MEKQDDRLKESLLQYKDDFFKKSQNDYLFYIVIVYTIS